LSFYIDTLKLAFNKSAEFDLTQIIANEVKQETEVDAKTFSFSQIESFLIPFISILDDLTKIDINTIKAVLTLGSLMMSSNCSVN
jgi:glycyl-tRNA synthetase beta subunit